MIKDSKNSFDVQENMKSHIEELDFATTDTGNAERLIGDRGKDFRYCEPLGGWLHWTGVRWQVDNAAIWEDAKIVGKALQREAAETNGRDDADRLWNHARYTLGEPGLRRMIALASKDARVRVEPGIFDADPHLLNLHNGTLDIRTRKLHDHSRDDLITKLAPVCFDQAAKAPDWCRFVKRVLPDEDSRRYVQKATGRALSGDKERREFYLNQGIGDNGKNTMYDTLLTLYGDYGMVLNIEVLMEKRKGSEATPDLVTLKGKRFVVSSESDDGQRLKAGLIKRLTGDQHITARALYKDPITFSRTFTLFMHVNHKPDVGDTGHAMWERVRLIPWTVSIPDKEKDRKLKERLDRELSGILNWLLDGYEIYAAEGLRPSAEVKEATNRYRDEQNKLKRFMEERCITPDQDQLYDTRDGLYVTKDALYEEYKLWCEGENIYAEQKRKFGERMIELRFDPDLTKKINGKKTRIWRGIALLQS